jgi:hypothetical protein
MAVYGLSLPRTSFDRPNGPVIALNPEWALRDNLVAVLDERTLSNVLNGQRGTPTGTVLRAVGHPLSGLTVGYGATVGVGSTDVVTHAWTTDLLMHSAAAWVYREGAGGGNLGVILNVQNEGGVSLLAAREQVSASAFRLVRGYDGSNNQWEVPWVLAQWVLLSWSWDQTVATTAARIFLNGIEQTPTNSQAASGTAVATATALRTGNLASGNRAWNGYIGPTMVWENRLLSPAEHWSLYDPQTRWDAYWQPSMKVWFDIAAVGGFVPYPHPRGLDSGTHVLSGGMQ